MIKVSIASGPTLTFPTAKRWQFTLRVLGIFDSINMLLAEIPINNVLFVERVEEENADA